MNMGERIKQLRLEKGLTQEELGNYIGVKKAAVMKYEKGNVQNMKRSTIEILSKLFNVSPSYLMCLEDNDGQNNKQYYMCPVYGQISAGQPNWAAENIEGRLPIDTELVGIINPEEHFFLRVNGESMNKIIKNGAFALIHKQDDVENGEIAVVLVNGFDATLKKFSKQGDLIILEPQSTNEDFETQVYDKTTNIKVLGKYVGKMEFDK